jgi:hypothetical protein
LPVGMERGEAWGCNSVVKWEISSEHNRSYSCVWR